MVTSSGDPASVQMVAYLTAEAADLLGRMKCSSMKRQMRGFMGQIRGFVRNRARYSRTASEVGASGLPVFVIRTPAFSIL